uniref:Uncharacterized protein n=1 Tax=Meloidogyne hapla TaxID=6305 RepID=A0A1I8B1V3_MELHA
MEIRNFGGVNSLIQKNIQQWLMLCQHNCNNNAANIFTQRIFTGIKRRAEETMDTPAAIRTRVLQQIPTPILANFPSKNATKKLVKRVRKEIEAPPPIPATIEELEIPEPYRRYRRNVDEDEKFLLFDSGLYDGQQRFVLMFSIFEFITLHSPGC